MPLGPFELEALEIIIVAITAISISLIVTRSPGAKARAEIKKLERMKELDMMEPSKNSQIEEARNLSQTKLIEQTERLTALVEKQNKRIFRLEEDIAFREKLNK